MKKFTATILMVSVITLFGCSDMTGEFKYMTELKKAISQTYETEKVEIEIKNNELTVTLVANNFDNYSSTKKEQISREIGKLAQEFRNDKAKIKSGVVKFREEENYIVAKTSNVETFPMYEQ